MQSPGTENPEVGQKNKKSEIGEEDVDIGEEMPVSHFPPVQIDKDATCASSSSRSSSGSSSSSDDSSSSGMGSILWLISCMFQALLFLSPSNWVVACSDSGSSSGSDSDADSVHSPCVESKEASVT